MEVKVTLKQHSNSFPNNLPIVEVKTANNYENTLVKIESDGVSIIVNGNNMIEAIKKAMIQ